MLLFILLFSLLQAQNVYQKYSSVYIHGSFSYDDRNKISQSDFQAVSLSLFRTPEEAANYCKKDGSYTEYGKLPTVIKGSDVAQRCVNLAEAGDLEAIKVDHPGYYIRYKSTLTSMLKFDLSELKGSCGVWISGPPRCGKDYAVRQLNSVFVKSMNKWWDGYRNEKYVLLSDVEPDHCKWLSYFLKIWADRYAFTAEIKGGSMVIRPRMIFVTSNFTIRQSIPDNIVDAIEARFTSYQFNEISGYEVRQRVENPASDRVLRVLQLYEPDTFVSDGVLASASPSTLSLEEDALFLPSSNYRLQKRISMFIQK